MAQLAQQEAAPVDRTAGRDLALTLGPAAVLIALALTTRFDTLALAESAADKVGKTLLTLFYVALVFERALEVFVTAWRGPGATALDDRVSAAEAALALAGQDTSLAPPERAELQRTLEKARTEAVTQVVAYRCATQRLALRTAFIVGLLLAVVGVRTLEPSLVIPPDLPRLQLDALKVLDALLTGGVIAGGSEGIHKVVQAFTDFAEATSKRVKAA